MVEDDRRPDLDQLGTWFEELSALLSGPPDPERVVSFAAGAVPHADHCGLTLVRGSAPPRTMAGSGPMVENVDRVQYACGEGPCLEAIDGHDVVRVDDLSTDRQWPKFAPRCVTETGVRSMFSVRLLLSTDARAALNFYASRPGVFDDLTVGTGAMLAPFAALAVQNALNEQEVTHLRTALHSSRQIGIAVGILMARNLMTADQAFAHLVTASQHLNRKVRDLADEVSRTGTLPDLPTRPK